MLPKKMTGKKASELKLEDESKKVGLDEMHKEFFSNEKTPKNKNYCDVTDSKIITEAKELCKKLVYHLENISKEQKPNQTEHCSYLRYWLYDKIGEIEKDNSAKTSKILFFNYLIEAWSKLNNAKLGKICVSPVVEDVTLDELKNRKYSYIYFKELGKIHNVSTSKNKDACSKYLTYLQSLSSLYEKYWKKQCDYFFWGPAAVDYFPCYYKYKLSYLMSGLQNCKDGKEPYSTPQRPSDSRTSRSGAGVSTSLPAKAGSAAAPIQAKPAISAGKDQENRAHLSTEQYRGVGGALTQPSGGTPQLVQGPPRSNRVTHIDNADMLNALSGVTPRSSRFSETASEMLKSDYFRHTLVGATVVYVLAFFLFFFKSTSMGSKTYERKKKRGYSDHNYYADYEEELSEYESEPSVEDLQMSDVYL